MSHSKFKFAGQAEILRAAQKDENYIRQLNEVTSNLTLYFGGKRFWLKYANYHIVFARFIYYASTSLFYLQTLGEEYTGIIPVQKSILKLLTFQKMLQYVMLLSGGHAILMNLMLNMEKITWPEYIHKYLNLTIIFCIKDALRVFKNIIPYLERFNKTIFYLNGNYYSFINRLLGVKYVLFHSWLKDEASLYGFKILAGISLVNLIASFIHSYPNWSNPESDEILATVKEVVPLSSQNTCRLCLNVRKNTSITPCGHLFCWNCIMEWLQVRKDCPLCKESLAPSRVTFLFNYDKCSNH